MRTILSFILILIAGHSYGQMQVEKKSHDFGNLYANAPTYVDFTFKNTGQSKVYLLGLNQPKEVYPRISTKTILPDSTVIVRLKINDNIKGRFNYKTEVSFSSSPDPFVITLTGNVKERNSNPLMSCPDFNSAPPANGLAQFDVTVKVIDSITGEPIKRSKVYFVSNGEMIADYYTNRDGIIHESIPLGLYYITAKKDSYIPNYYDGYLNFRTNYVEIKLQQPEKMEEPEEVVITEPELEVTVNEPEVETPVIEEPTIIIEEVDEEINEIIIDENDVVETPEPNIILDTIPSIPSPADTGFNSSKYLPNNIVFIVDVSSSMNQMGKIDLLKLSMIELTKILRPQDQVSVLAYAGSVNVLFELKNGTDRDEKI